MRISKEKLESLKKRGRRAGRALASGSKSTAYEGAAGAIASYAATMLDSKVDYAAKNPWVKGAALVLAGHMCKGRKNLAPVGAALCGAGGYALGLHFQAKKAAAKTSASTQAPATEAAGVYNMNDFVPADTGMVFRSAARAA
jgi:hypothetical protein